MLCTSSTSLNLVNLVFLTLAKVHLWLSLYYICLCCLCSHFASLGMFSSRGLSGHSGGGRFIESGSKGGKSSVLSLQVEVWTGSLSCWYITSFSCSRETSSCCRMASISSCSSTSVRVPKMRWDRIWRMSDTCLTNDSTLHWTCTTHHCKPPGWLSRRPCRRGWGPCI